MSDEVVGLTWPKQKGAATAPVNDGSADTTATDNAATAAHDQTEGHKYVVHFPAHLPRTSDPNYPAFDAYHRATKDKAVCYIGQRVGFDSCSKGTPLELHHAHVEFSLINGVDPAAFAIDYPKVGDAAAIAAWAETAENFRWLCVFHHRGHAGAHTASHSDWEAGQYVKALVSVKAPIG